MITKFASWKPEGLETPKAILVLTPPSQSDGRYETRDKEWQAFAVRHDLALVGCYFQDHKPSGVEDYCAVNGVGGKAAGQALREYLLKTFDPDCSGALMNKLLMWGFSAGGQFNYEFANACPQWVKAFVVNKGGIYYTHVCSQETRNIPSLWIIGGEDSKWRQMSVAGIYMVNKTIGAPNWTLREEPNVSHAVGDSEYMGREFFETLLDPIKP